MPSNGHRQNFRSMPQLQKLCLKLHLPRNFSPDLVTHGGVGKLPENASLCAFAIKQDRKAMIKNGEFFPTKTSALTSHEGSVSWPFLFFHETGSKTNHLSHHHRNVGGNPKFPSASLTADAEVTFTGMEPTTALEALSLNNSLKPFELSPHHACCQFECPVVCICPFCFGLKHPKRLHAK